LITEEAPGKAKLRKSLPFICWITQEDVRGKL